jgi:hypothetical protein
VSKSPASPPDCMAPLQNQPDPSSQKPGFSRWPARLCLIAFGILIGHWQAAQPSLEAQLRKTEQPQAFLSGSERCEIILKDMHKTLQTMDQRLANLEQTSQLLVKPK